MARRKKGLSFYQKKTINKSHIREALSWLFLAVLALLLAFVFSYSVGMTTVNVGASMEPNIYSGQTVLISRIDYLFHSPKRGDVVVFRPNGNEATHYYVKRVVALPGETISISDGRIYIDGYFVEESDLFDTIEDGGIATNGITMGDKEYFVLGDNRNNSEDSRSANIGVVSEDYIVGRAWFRIGGGARNWGGIE